MSPALQKRAKLLTFPADRGIISLSIYIGSEKPQCGSVELVAASWCRFTFHRDLSSELLIQATAICDGARSGETLRAFALYHYTPFRAFCQGPGVYEVVCLKKVVAIEPLPGREGLFLMQPALSCYFCGRSSGRSLFLLSLPEGDRRHFGGLKSSSSVIPGVFLRRFFRQE